MKKEFTLTVSIKLSIPSDFKGIEPWSKIECIDDFISHWITEGYYIDDHIVELPDGIKFLGYDTAPYPESWWKELIPKDKWENEKPYLIKNKLILKTK